MANSESLEDLVKRFPPVTQAKLRGTEIAADADRLRYLLTLPRDEQEGTVSRLSLGLTWEASLPKVANNRESKDQGSIALVAVSGGAERGGSGICGCDDESVASTAIGKRESPPSDPDPVPQVVRVAVNELRPNSVNATIFSDSLADEQLRDLADHLARYGQQEPIRVDVAYTILDGQRRWRALTLIGAKYANVVVDKLQRSRDELEDLVIDAFSLKRKPSLEEQLRVYDIAVRSYTRRYGRVVGRPRKLDKNLSGFWSHKQICTAAAKAAGFGSREPVRQARRVLKEADEETKKAMLSGRLSIGAAYATLRPSADADADDDVDESTGGAGTLPDVPRGVAATADEAARQTNGGRLPPISEPAVVHPVKEAVPQKLSDAPSLPDSTRRPDADLLPRQMPDGVASNASSSKAEEPQRGAPAGSAAPAASSRRDRTTAHTEASERRSYLRARASVVRHIAGLREGDEADARRERDEAVGLIDAAAYGTREGDGDAAAPAADRSWSASEGYDGDDAQSDTHDEDVEDLNVVDGRGYESEGAGDLNVAGEEDDETEDEEDLDEEEDHEDLDETEDDEGLDDEELDDETEDEVEAAVGEAGHDAAETGEKDDLSRAASREDDDDDIRIQYAPNAVRGETFDYSDYEDAADEDAEEPEQQDAGGSEVDDEARFEDDWSDEDGDDEDEDEEGDPEVDELLGLKRRRRP